MRTVKTTEVEKKSYATRLSDEITNLKKIGEALKASELSYRRLFETARDGILILDAETGKITDVNPFLIELLGYSKQQFIKKTVWEIGLFKDIALNRDNFLELQQKGYVRYEDLPLQTFDGRHIAVEFVSNIYMVGNQKVIQCNIRDITQRKQIDEYLNIERERAQTYFDMAEVLLVVIGMDGKITRINKKGCETLGLEAKDLIGKMWIDNFVQEPWIVETMNAFDSITKGMNNDVFHQNSIIGANNQARLINWHKKALYDNKGIITGFLSSGIDITEQNKAENALIESESKYRSYIDNAPDGVVITDEKGLFIEVNKAACEITGYDKQQLLQMRIRDITADESKDMAAKYFKRLLKEGSLEGILQYRHNDGSSRWWSITAVKLTEQRFMGFTKDVTDWKRANDELSYISYHDKLTGLYNRRYFEEEKTRLDTKRNLPISIIMGDINGLKIINDSFGHGAGDSLLKSVAAVLKSCFREEDIVARWGGDEFVVLLPNTPNGTALRMCKRINAKLRKAETEPVSMSVAFGYSTKKSYKQAFSEVMKVAEDNMYKNKLLDIRSGQR